MGKGKRLRTQQRPQRPVFATEPAELAMDDQRPGRLSSYTRRELTTNVTAWMILLTYLEVRRGLCSPDQEEIAEVLRRWVAPSMVPGILQALTKEAATRLDEAGHSPDPTAWADGARPLLNGLCPSQALPTALEHATALAATRLEPAEPTALLQHEQLAAIHATAALVAWLYSQPDIVPDEAAAHHELAERASKFGEYAF